MVSSSLLPSSLSHIERKAIADEDELWNHGACCWFVWFKRAAITRCSLGLWYELRVIKRTAVHNNTRVAKTAHISTNTMGRIRKKVISIASHRTRSQPLHNPGALSGRRRASRRVYFSFKGRSKIATFFGWFQVGTKKDCFREKKKDLTHYRAILDGFVSSRASIRVSRLTRRRSGCFSSAQCRQLTRAFTGVRRKHCQQNLLFCQGHQLVVAWAFVGKVPGLEGACQTSVSLASSFIYDAITGVHQAS